MPLRTGAARADPAEQAVEPAAQRPGAGHGVPAGVAAQPGDHVPQHGGGRGHVLDVLADDRRRGRRSARRTASAYGRRAHRAADRRAAPPGRRARAPSTPAAVPRGAGRRAARRPAPARSAAARTPGRGTSTGRGRPAATAQPATSSPNVSTSGPPMSKVALTSGGRARQAVRWWSTSSMPMGWVWFHARSGSTSTGPDPAEVADHLEARRARADHDPGLQHGGRRRARPAGSRPPRAATPGAPSCAGPPAAGRRGRRRGARRKRPRRGWPRRGGRVRRSRGRPWRARGRTRRRRPRTPRRRTTGRPCRRAAPRPGPPTGCRAELGRVADEATHGVAVVEEPGDEPGADVAGGPDDQTVHRPIVRDRSLRAARRGGAARSCPAARITTSTNGTRRQAATAPTSTPSGRAHPAKPPSWVKVLTATSASSSARGAEVEVPLDVRGHAHPAAQQQSGSRMR